MALGKIIIEEVRAGHWNAEVEFSTGVGGRYTATSFDEMLKLLAAQYKRLVARQSGVESALIRKGSTEPERPAPEPTMALIRRAQEEAGLADDANQVGRKMKRAPRPETWHPYEPQPAVDPNAPRQTRGAA